MSLIIAFTGLYFAYSSVERLMYPTSVSYRTKYLFILIATALVKLFMFTVFRYLQNKSRSDILRVMSTDCILDFFITSVTVMTLLISTYGTYAADALCGIVISIVITVSAVKMIKTSFGKLIGYVPKEKRELFLQELYQVIDEDLIETVSYSLTENKCEAFVFTAVSPAENQLNKISKKTGITVYIIPRKENTDPSV